MRRDEALDQLLGELDLLQRALRRDRAADAGERDDREGGDKTAEHLLHDGPRWMAGAVEAFALVGKTPARAS